MKFFLSTAALVVAFAPRVAYGAPITTCADQYQCLDWSIESVSDGPCNGECMKVCMTLNMGKGSCIKGGGNTISHVCDVAGCDGCQSKPLAFLGNADTSYYCGDDNEFHSGKVNTVPDGTVMCQYGSPGDEIFFIVKDGSNDDAVFYNFTSSDHSDQCKPKLECTSVASNVWGFDIGCGGAVAQKTFEKIWKVTIPGNTPDDCGNCPSVTPMAPTAPTASPPTPITAASSCTAENCAIDATHDDECSSATCVGTAPDDTCQKSFNDVDIPCTQAGDSAKNEAGNSCYLGKFCNGVSRQTVKTLFCRVPVVYFSLLTQRP